MESKNEECIYTKQLVHSLQTEGVLRGISSNWLWRDESWVDLNIASKFELYLVLKGQREFRKHKDLCNFHSYNLHPSFKEIFLVIGKIMWLSWCKMITCSRENVTTLVNSKKVMEFVRHQHDGLLSRCSGKEFPGSHPMFLDCISSFSSS